MSVSLANTQTWHRTFEIILTVNDNIDAMETQTHIFIIETDDLIVLQCIWMGFEA